jgi:O-acetyl-ADP-ribose deacetylase (regulator of RNase III)
MIRTEDAVTQVSGAQPTPPEPHRETFRGLEVHSLLGEGGMGAAWLVSHPILRAPLVVKTFQTKPGEDPFREAWLAARVRSPHAVEVVDAGWENGQPYIVQRYVDGPDVDELWSRWKNAGHTLPIGVVASIAVDAARGLHAIHQAGVVHRDVKPANLFLDGTGRCLTGDFGVAIDAHLEPDAAPSGTPLFTPPEAWMGEVVDRRADLYSLGAMIHLLATNEPAFWADRVERVGWKHVRDAYERPVGSTPQEAFVFAVVDRLLSKNPADRYANAADVADILRPMATRRPDVVQSPTGARCGSLEIKLSAGDLARTPADVLVSAANPELTMGLGVACSLREAGGRHIEKQAMLRAPAAMGDVIVTDAGDLPARWLIHAVAARDGAVCIQRATLRALLEAEARGATSIAFPSLGTGIGQVSVAQAAALMLEATRTFAWLEPRSLREVRFVLHRERGFRIWDEVLSAI